MTIEIQHITDHVDRAQNRLLEQYNGEDDPENMVKDLTVEVQKLEDMFDQLHTLRDIDNAVGAQLDRLGTVVGFPRNTSDDDVYRLEIRAKIVKNVSQGEAERLISVYKFMTEASYVIFQDNPPACLMMASDGVIPPALINANLIYELAQQTAGSGVKVGWLELFPAVGPFGFQGPLNKNRGFASIAQPTDGGKYGHLLRQHHPFGYGKNNKNIRGFGTITLGEPNVGGNYEGL